MSISSPYENLAKTAFWRSGVAEASPYQPEGIYSKKWNIPYEYKIATAGSCFAQHISRELKQNGFNVLDMEPAPYDLPKKLHNKFGFSMYSARYGNIYTTQQLLQLAKEVVGKFTPADTVWEKDGRFYDALRPAVEPSGYASVAELTAHRKHHLSKVEELFSTMDLFIFTLGLTEAWVHKESGTVYPTAPGTIAGAYDKNKYIFKNYSFIEVMKAFTQFLGIIRSIREDRSTPKVLLTVSPVPLTATASGKHVLQATTYSKSVLRAVAGEFASNHENIDYFPSYEIITNQAAKGEFYESNLRSVRSDGVEVVMNTFFAEHKPSENNGKLTNLRRGRRQAIQSEPDDDDLQCEEALVEFYNR